MGKTGGGGRVWLAIFGLPPSPYLLRLKGLRRLKQNVFSRNVVFNMPIFSTKCVYGCINMEIQYQYLPAGAD